MPYANAGAMLFSRWFESVEYYVSERNDTKEKNIKQQYINAMNNNSDIDEDFKKYIKNPSNIKLNCYWAIASDILFSNIALTCHYEESYSFSYNERATIEGNHVSFHSDTGKGVRKSTNNSYHYDYLGYSSVSYKIKNKDLTFPRNAFGDFSKFRKVDDIPPYVTEYGATCKTDAFVLNQLNHIDISDIEAESRRKCVELFHDAKPTFVSYKSCEVEKLKVYFVPIYSISVKYENRTFNTDITPYSSTISFKTTDGQKSEECLQREYEERTTSDIKHKFHSTRNYLLCFELLFAIISMISWRCVGAFFKIPFYIFLIAFVVSFSCMIIAGILINKKITFEKQRKFLRIQHVLVHIIYLAVLLLFCCVPNIIEKGFTWAFVLFPWGIIITCAIASKL